MSVEQRLIFPCIALISNPFGHLGFRWIYVRIYECQNWAKNLKSMIADLCYLSENYKNSAPFRLSDLEPEKR
jgi:hypothetical protein